MSYNESQVFLSEAASALSRGKYDYAADQYATVLSGLAPVAVVARPHTPESRALAQQYAAASRGRSAALAQLGDVQPAEQTLLAALDYLRGCISNLGTPAMERAPLLTEYKLCFYALAEFYFAHQMAEQLGRYVRRHAPELARWASDLHLVRAAQGAAN